MTETAKPRIILAMVLLMGCTADQKQAVQRATSSGSGPRETAIERYVRAQHEEFEFRGAVLVARGGEILLREGYGEADTAGTDRISPETRFPIASVTKPITATAIATLVSRGVVSFEDPVCDYLVTCPSSWRRIHISNVLDHTSGIPELRPRRIRGLSLSEAVDEVMRLELQFEVGTDWAYSNANYWIAGRIIELASGRPWAQYLDRSVFAPAGMTSTGPDHELMSTATGFTLSLNRSGTPSVVTSRLSSRAGHATLAEDPAGGLVSTVDDLHAFIRGLDTGRLLSSSILGRMWTSVGAGRFGDYGLGWEVFDEAGRSVVQHGGAMPGFGTCIRTYPVEAIEIVVLSNLQETIACEYVAHDLAAIAMGEPYELPRAPEGVKVPTSVLERYVGEYEAGRALGDEVVAVRLRRGALVMRGLASVGPPYVQETVLRPFGRTRFFNPQDPHVEISFRVPGSEDAVLLVHRPPYKRLPAMTERFVRQ